MTQRRQRKCLNCGELFRADPRNLRHQRYCSAHPCRKASKASKAASQARWLSKPQNRNYFRGPEHGERVRAWRAANPGYGRGRRRALQDHSLTQAVDLPKKNRLFNDAGVTRRLLRPSPCFIGTNRLVNGYGVTRGHSPFAAAFSTIGARHPQRRTPSW